MFSGERAAAEMERELTAHLLLEDEMNEVFVGVVVGCFQDQPN
jgi:hypothetical protein